MPVAVTVTAWALLSIEEIGHTLEDPFNSPTVPLNVQAYLEQPLGFEPLLQAQRPFEVTPEIEPPPPSAKEADEAKDADVKAVKVKSTKAKSAKGAKDAQT